jgi:putative membrane protein insertion efficiency factor
MFIKIISLPIHIYRLFISPLTGKNCRFEPTCSEYALTALKTHGIFYGSYLSIKRILKCHPFSRYSGYDPVPNKKQSKDITR